MKLFIQKMLLLSIPFVLYGLLMILVDPYNYFNVCNIINDRVKLETAYKLDNCLWKLIEYKRKPISNILLGDSRLENIDVKEIEKITGEKYYNFAYGGGSLPEIVDTFWYSTKKCKLRNVYIGINFNLYNSYNSRNRFTTNNRLLGNPFLYVLNYTVIDGLRYNIYRQCINKEFRIGVPTLNRKRFWKHQLEVVSPFFYKRYQYPKHYYKQLVEIANYCHKNTINLVFIIPPTHVELQNLIVDFNLTTQHKKFKEDLKKLVIIYDFNYPNDFTKNKNNFLDPYHCRKEINPVVSEVWGNKIKYAIINDCKVQGVNK